MVEPCGQDFPGGSPGRALPIVVRAASRVNSVRGAPAGTSSGANRLQFGVHIGGWPRRSGVAQPLEDAHQVLPFPITEAIRPGGILGDRVPDDMALRFAQPRGGASSFRNRGVVERERSPCHNEALLP